MEIRIRGWMKKIFADTDSTLLIYFFFTLSLAAFVSILFLSPFLIKSENFFLLGVSSLTYKLVSEARICHQLPERTYALGGILMPVCVRDFSIFLGGFLGLAFSFFRTPKFFLSKFFLLLATLPIAADGVTQTLLLLRESSHAIRFFTGILFGTAFAHFLGKKILEERTSSDSRKNLAVASGMILVLFFLFSALAFGYGHLYKSGSYATNAALRQSRVGNPYFINTYYIPPESVFSIRLDPFLGNYSDAVLSDLAGLKKKTRFGMWVVVILEEPPSRKGKYVFFTAGRGEYFFFDAFSGEILERRIHR